MHILVGEVELQLKEVAQLGLHQVEELPLMAVEGYGHYHSATIAWCTHSAGVGDSLLHSLNTPVDEEVLTHDHHSTWAIRSKWDHQKSVCTRIDRITRPPLNVIQPKVHLIQC